MPPKQAIDSPVWCDTQAPPASPRTFDTNMAKAVNKAGAARYSSIAAFIGSFLSNQQLDHLPKILDPHLVRKPRHLNVMKPLARSLALGKGKDWVETFHCLYCQKPPNIIRESSRHVRPTHSPQTMTLLSMRTGYQANQGWY